MAAPWEKYQQQTAATAKPWEKYAAAAADEAPVVEAAEISESAVGRQPIELSPHNVRVGLAELLASGVTGTAAMIPAGFAGLGTMAGRALGLTEADPADVVRSIEHSLTYEPRSAAGRAGAEMLARGAQWVGRQFDPALAAIGRVSPTAENVVSTAVPAIAEAASILVPAAQPARTAIRAAQAAAAAREAAREAAARAPARTPVEVARAAGYRLKPSEAGGKAGTIAEGLSGSARLERTLVVKNQAVTDRLAAEEIGLEPGKPITQAALKRAKQPHNAVYDEVGRTLGTFETTPEFIADLQKAMPTRGATRRVREDIADLIAEHSLATLDAKDAIQMTRQLRAKSAKMIRSDDPDVETRGYAMRAISDAIEQELERQALRVVQPDLLNRWRDARTALAKIHTVESARVGSSVSATKLAKLAQRGEPLSGRLKLIADVASEFPNVTRLASKVKDNTPVTVLEGAVSAGGTAITANPAFLTALVPRPVTRAILASNLYQNRLGQVAIGPTLEQRLAQYFERARPQTSVTAPVTTEPGTLADELVGPGVEALPWEPQSISTQPLVIRAASDTPRDLGLELVPDPVPGAQVLPSAPRVGELMAEVPPPIRGDIPFTPSAPLAAANLAGELELLGDALSRGVRPEDLIEYVPPRPPPAAASLAGDLELATDPRALRSPAGPAAADDAVEHIELEGDQVRTTRAPLEDVTLASPASDLVIKPKTSEKATRAIRSLAKRVAANPSDNTRSVIQYGESVSPKTVEAFRKGGVDVSGYTHIIDNYAVRHTLKNHGDASRELARGQLPVTADDLAKLPEIIRNPDSVDYAGKTDQGRHAVIYRKQVNGHVLTVEEARTGRKQLAFVSMRKVARHEQMPDLAAEAPAPNVRNDGGSLPHAAGESTTTPAQGEHIELHGENVRRSSAPVEQIKIGRGRKG